MPGSLPIQSGKFNFIDVTNDGLQLGINPNQAAFELWTQIEQQINEIEIKRNDESSACSLFPVALSYYHVILLCLCLTAKLNCN